MESIVNQGTLAPLKLDKHFSEAVYSGTDFSILHSISKQAVTFTPEDEEDLETAKPMANIVLSA